MIGQILTAIGSLLAALAPDIARAITGGQDPEEAIANARRLAEGIPVRVGDDGAWEPDLEERIGGGEKPIDQALLIEGLRAEVSRGIYAPGTRPEAIEAVRRARHGEPSRETRRG